MDCNDRCATPPTTPLPYRVKAYHPFSIMRSWEKTTTCFSEDDKIDMCLEYLADIPFASNCKVLKKRRGQTHQSCNCLQILEDEIAQEAIAKYMIYFYKKTKIERQLIVMDWIKYVGPDNNSKAMYYLPFFNDSDSIYLDEDREATVQNLSSHLEVCRSALRVILDFGYTQWITCQKHVIACTTPTHGLCQRRSNHAQRFDTYVKEDLFAFFEDQVMLATPQATRGAFWLEVVRDSQVCYRILSAHRPFYSYNARNAVKYHFFLGIVSVWWLLQPSTPPIPHKSTYSNLMRGLGSIVWFMYHHT